MTQVASPRNPLGLDQFGLHALLEYVALCSVLAALSPAIGLAASGCLMLMALALGIRRGTLALGMFIVALIVDDSMFAGHGIVDDVARRALVVVLAGALCAGYRLRRHAQDLAQPAEPLLFAPHVHSRAP